MSDLIRREDAIKTVHKYFIKLLDKIPTETDEDGDTVYSDMKTVNSLLTINKWLTKEIKAIPTAEPKIGRNVKEEWDSLFECSVCGWECGDTYMCDTATFNFCPNCGARMKGADDE